MKRKDWEIS